MTKNKTIKTDTETITKISDFVWELSTEMDAIKDQNFYQKIDLKN